MKAVTKALAFLSAVTSMTMASSSCANYREEPYESQKEAETQPTMTAKEDTKDVVVTPAETEPTTNSTAFVAGEEVTTSCNTSEAVTTTVSKSNSVVEEKKLETAQTTTSNTATEEKVKDTKSQAVPEPTESNTEKSTVSESKEADKPKASDSVVQENVKSDGIIADASNVRNDETLQSEEMTSKNVSDSNVAESSAVAESFAENEAKEEKQNESEVQNNELEPEVQENQTIKIGSLTFETGVKIQSERPDTYIVKEGDNLSCIADLYDISLDKLIEENQDTIEDINIILPGDIVKIPSVSSEKSGSEEVSADLEVETTESEKIEPEATGSEISEPESAESEKTESEISEPETVESEQKIADETETVDQNDFTAEDLEEELNSIRENINIDIPIVDYSQTEYEEITQENSATEVIALETETESANTVETDVIESEAAEEIQGETDNVVEETAFDDSTFEDLFNTSVLTDAIEECQEKYPFIEIGMGVYGLDGSTLFEHNPNSCISGACTIKAPYAMFVLKRCEELGIDIYSETIVYTEDLRNDGSGIIKDSKDGTEYTIFECLRLLLSISDNTAYNMLTTRFPLGDFQTYLYGIGGQSNAYLQYGAPTVTERKNEWLEIYNYINSGSKYSETLRNMMSNTQYAYMVDGMSKWHSYLHKSGWCDGLNYTSASDCGIIEDDYLLVILTADYSTGEAHTDVVNRLGLAAEQFWEN